MNSGFFAYSLSREKRGSDGSRGYGVGPKPGHTDGISGFRLDSEMAVCGSGEGARGLADYELGGDTAMGGGNLTLFQDGIDPFHDDADRGSAHGFHGLADGRKRWSVQGRSRDVVEAHHGALLGNPYIGTVQGTDGSEGAHVVKSK